MAKHGICNASNKRNYGKGRKKKPTILTKRFIGSSFAPDGVISYHARKYRALNQASWGGLASPSKSRVIGNRRRRRRTARASVTLVQAELREEKVAKKRAVEKMKKTHARTVRQMQKRFLRDIHKLWETQAEQMSALEEGI